MDSRLLLDARRPAASPGWLRSGSHAGTPIALQATRSLFAWMLMEPTQDSLFQALLEYCPGLQIDACAHTVQLQARDLECLADILPHSTALTIPMRTAEALAEPLHSLAQAVYRRHNRRRRYCRFDQAQRSLARAVASA